MHDPSPTSDGSPSVRTSPTRVVLVDDSPDFRRLLVLVLGSDETLEVVAEAGDGAAGVVAVQEHRPDVVITDLQMPELDGIGLTRAVRQEYPDLPIVLLTAYPTPEAMEEAEEAGVTCCLAKRGDVATVVPRTLRELQLNPRSSAGTMSSS